MRQPRTYLVVGISSIALLIVLIIQVRWIVQTAKIKEDLFNEKSNIVLARTTEALSADAEACRHIETGKGALEKHKIDSLLTHYMDYYNFHAAYSFELITPNPFSNNITFNNQPPDQGACYKKSLNEMAIKNRWELKLIFPEKYQFIVAEMETLFTTSLFLITIVLLLFWRTIRSLIQEKKIAEHTTDFLNNMTHEFKTPLTNISLATKMIVKESAAQQEDKVKHYSGIILEENEKLRLQVEQVLSMTALERGEIPLQKAVLDFHQMITDVVKRISIQIENKKGTVQLDLNAQKCIVIADKTHLTNALSNLFDNAIKYSREGSAFKIETSNTDHYLIVAISDNGPGIEKEYHQKIFDKYFRVPTGNVHNVKGFGLGLAYVKTIVELHGGKIEVKSETGFSSGTTFIISLPYV